LKWKALQEADIVRLQEQLELERRNVYGNAYSSSASYNEE